MLNAQQMRDDNFPCHLWVAIQQAVYIENGDVSHSRQNQRLVVGALTSQMPEP